VEADGLGLRSSGLWSDAEAGVSAARGRDRREATHPLVVSSGARRRGQPDFTMGLQLP